MFTPYALFLEGSAVTDVTLLGECPLEVLSFTPGNITNGIQTIRNIPTLETINDLDASDFWKDWWS